LWFASLDGSLGYVLPCSEKTYRRLLMLQNVLVTSIPHTAGLNPKGFRTLKQRRRELVNPSRGIIDGELVFKFTDLPYMQKVDIAKKIGTKPVDILDDLAELDRMAAHF
jgi:cleavage and polyadenylation specificity factor subunit 1